MTHTLQLVNGFCREDSRSMESCVIILEARIRLLESRLMAIAMRLTEAQTLEDAKGILYAIKEKGP